MGIPSGCLKRNDSLVNEGNYGLCNEQAICHDGLQNRTRIARHMWISEDSLRRRVTGGVKCGRDPSQNNVSTHLGERAFLRRRE